MRFVVLYQGVLDSSDPAVDRLRSLSTSGLTTVLASGGFSCRILLRLNHVPVVSLSRSFAPLDGMVLAFGLVEPDADIGGARLAAGDTAAPEVKSVLSVTSGLPKLMV